MCSTISALSLGFVLSVAHARIFNNPGEFVPNRPSAEQLASHTDFNGLTLFGDFRVEIRQQDTFSIEYQPLSTVGALEVSQAGAQLNLTGFGNSQGGQTSLVRIGMPDLDNIRATASNSIVVSGFTLDALNVNLNNARDFLLDGNTIETLTLTGNASNTITVQDTSISNQRYDIRGVSSILVTE
jgi:hypothetical protein